MVEYFVSVCLSVSVPRSLLPAPCNSRALTAISNPTGSQRERERERERESVCERENNEEKYVMNRHCQIVVICQTMLGVSLKKGAFCQLDIISKNSS